jgi:hypothetical protein
MDEETLDRRPGLATLAEDVTHLAASLARDIHTLMIQD